MRTGKTIKPGRPGTARWVGQFGDRLVAVRYRYDSERKMRYTTAELIVEECPWVRGTSFPRGSGHEGLHPEVVFIRVSILERELRARVKAAGGVWNGERKAWELRFDEVIRLGLKGRIKFVTDPP